MIDFKKIPDEEKPRERLLLYGSRSLSNEELLMIILKTGTKKRSVKEIAVDLLSVCEGVRNLKCLSYQKLIKIEGIGKVKAIEILALIELCYRMNLTVTEKDMVSLHHPSIIVQYFYDLFQGVKQEEFYCIYLDHKKKFLNKKRLYIGTINSSLVHPREIFREAYLLSSSYIICIHNHPSGDPSPSKEDIHITEKLKELGELHAIYLVDHLIIGNQSYYSFYENHCILNNR